MTKIFQNMYACDLIRVNVEDELRWWLDWVKVAITLVYHQTWDKLCRGQTQGQEYSEPHHSCLPCSSWGCTSNSRGSGLWLLWGISNQEFTLLQQREILVCQSYIQPPFIPHVETCHTVGSGAAGLAIAYQELRASRMLSPYQIPYFLR